MVFSSQSFARLCRIPAFAALFLSLVFSGHAMAANVDSACDAAFLSKLKDRAWAEAQREIMHNQQMVWKPDSVLALGCASNWLGLIPTNFSNNGGSSVSGTMNFMNNSYLQASFNHDLGGGNLPVGRSTTSTNCGLIFNLWSAAHCKNITLAEIQSFDDASTTDPRKTPSACSNTGGSWGQARATITSAGAGAPFDAMNLFIGVVGALSETGTGSSKKCSAGIPTGVMLAGGTNKEIVCPNPGCTPTGGASPKCCQTGTTSGSTCQ